jgi:hypothetical protein
MLKLNWGLNRAHIGTLHSSDRGASVAAERATLRAYQRTTLKRKAAGDLETIKNERVSVWVSTSGH